jgi:hypothetical protein
VSSTPKELVKKARSIPMLLQKIFKIRPAICLKNGITAFRINSQILPFKTHPKLGYAIRIKPYDA